MLRLLAAAVLALAGLAGCGVEESPGLDGVAVLVNRSADSTRLRPAAFCGAVLVSSTQALTAAHCVRGRPEPDLVHGVDDLCRPVDSADRVAVRSIVLGQGRFRELALLRLARPVDDASPPTVARQASESGWFAAIGPGRRDAAGPRACRLKQMSLQSLPISGCAADLRAEGVEAPALGDYLCLKPRLGSANTCGGDSGSGVLAADARPVELVGVTLGGRGCGPDDPGLYLGPTLLRAFLAAHR